MAEAGKYVVSLTAEAGEGAETFEVYSTDDEAAAHQRAEKIAAELHRQTTFEVWRDGAVNFIPAQRIIRIEAHPRDNG